jgi:hypothetical protein
LNTNNGLPQARRDGLIVRELPDEVLVYDLERHKAHCLNSTAAQVWRHCDGETAPDEIAFRLARELGEPVEADMVWLALEDLSKLELLDAPVVRPAGLSRADVVRRGALVASAVAVPAVFSLLAPTASAAVCGESCGPGVACTGTCTNCVGGTCSS